MKRDGTVRVKHLVADVFYCFKNDALPRSEGDFWYDNNAKQSPGMVWLPSGVMRSQTPALNSSGLPNQH